MIESQDTQVPFSTEIESGAVIKGRKKGVKPLTAAEEGWTLKALRSEVRGTHYWSATREDQQVECRYDSTY